MSSATKTDGEPLDDTLLLAPDLADAYDCNHRVSSG
jgi:hypothetical protein